MSILLVEDEALVRMLGADVLADGGFDVVEASNADEALSILESRSDFRALFTDIDMPGSMNGLELAHVVFERWPDMKILVVSGKVRPVEDELPPGGCFVDKPYRPADLLRELRHLLAGAE